MRSLTHSTRRLLLPLLAGLLVCLAWAHYHVHLGIEHRILAAAHHRLPAPSATQSLVLVFGAAAVLVALARAGVDDAVGRVPEAAIPWGGGRPLTREDLLAGAAFGAYAANRTAARFPAGPIAYRRAGPLLVVLGGPSGDPETAHAAQAAFRSWAGRRPIVWYGSGSRAGGVHLGREAIVRLPGRDLASARAANLRHSVSRARRAGVEVVHATWAELPGALRAQLRELEREHRRRHALRLRLTLSSLEDGSDSRAWGLAVREGGVEAAVTWLDATDGRGLVLDLMRRRVDAAPGAMELLIHEGLLRGRAAGREWASLGLVGDRSPEGLRRFKAKFGPEWHERYIAAPGVPRALAVAAVLWAHLAPWRAA